MTIPLIHSNKVWKRLLTPKTLYTNASKKEVARSAFHKDYDRLIFSQSFRQLNQKTQVHPLTQQLGIHTRLTHSLEVSCIGRSLGMMSAEKLGKHLPDTVSIADMGVIVQAACLAHDIGNPPFGHAGEYAIRDWFFKPEQKAFLTRMTARQQMDLLGFEGNAQGFRVLTRNEHHPDNGGMRLTCATLGAFLKYPWLSTPVNDASGFSTNFQASNFQADLTPSTSKKSGKMLSNTSTILPPLLLPISPPLSPLSIHKFGCFDSDMHTLENLGEQLGLVRSDIGFYRHPLAYLLEAADDICYALIDLEDGILLGMLGYEEVEPLLLRLVGKRRGVPPEVKSNAPIAQKLAALRGRAMRRLVDKVTDAFVKNQAALLDGTLVGSLFDHCPDNVRHNMHAAKTLARQRIFNHPSKIRMEIMANHCLHTLLDAFMPLALLEGLGEADGTGHNPQIRQFEQQRLMMLLNGHLANYGRRLNDDVYHNALCILDMITGMNDHEAYELAQELKGSWSYRT